jgi:nucleolin
MMEKDESKSWRDAVLSVVEGTSEAIKLKKLRKQVLITLQLDDSDKASKKTFKQTIQSLEETGELSLDADGLITLTNKGKKRKPKKEKKDKKEKKKRKTEKSEESTEKEAEPPQEENSAQHADSDIKEEESPESGEDRNKACKGNPQGATRIFCGNLPFTVDEASLGTFLKDKVTHIKWITDKETGKFYGSAFLEMHDSMAAAEAVAMAGQQLMGRPIKINFAPAPPGEVWPPEKKVITGGPTAGGGRAAGGMGVKALPEKPENCLKLFIGNLSYEIDDDGIKKFFSNVEAEVKAVRWLSHKESGDFKGWYVVLNTAVVSRFSVFLDGLSSLIL